MAEIKEQSGITPQQYAQFLPKQKYNIPKSTLQKVKSVITSLNSGIVSDTFSNTASTPYDFVINANNMGVIDLSQCYFNIAGELQLPTNVSADEIVFGNLFISSLFQNATLDIGGANIAMNISPGIDGNIQAMLKFDQMDLKSFSLADREFMINDISARLSWIDETLSFNAADFKVYAEGTGAAVTGTYNVVGYTPAGKEKLTLAGKTIYYYSATQLDLTGTANQAKTSLMKITFDDQGFGNLIAYNVACTNMPRGKTNEINSGAWENTQFKIRAQNDFIKDISKNPVIPKSNGKGFTGSIPFRCKLYLSDLFNYTVDSLDYVFNRDIKITLTRASSSFLVANLSHLGSSSDAKIDVLKTTKFELICFSYLLTDTARNQLISYYSKPVDTLYGVQTLNLTPLYNITQNVEQTIVLPLTLAYDTKAIILAFPKCPNCLTPLSTGINHIVDGQIVAGSVNNNNYQTSWVYSNSNSLNYCALRSVRLSNTNNSNIYFYDFAGTQEKFKNMSPFLKSFDFSNKAEEEEGINNDYREAYEQYKQLRLLFSKSPDNAIDYYTFIKDYFIIPIDLTGSNIPPNTRIFVTFQVDSYSEPYNPFYYGNIKVENSKQRTTNLLAIYLGSDVLTYNPDGTCIVKHVLSANPQNTVGYTIN